MNFKPKKKNPKTKTRKDVEQKNRAICDIIPVYPNIATKIPKNKKHSKKIQSLPPAAVPIDHVSEYERPTKEDEQPFNAHGPLYIKRNRYYSKKCRAQQQKFEQPELKRKANQIFDSLGAYEPIDWKRKYDNSYAYSPSASPTQLQDESAENAIPFQSSPEFFVRIPAWCARTTNHTSHESACGAFPNEENRHSNGIQSEQCSSHISMHNNGQISMFVQTSQHVEQIETPNEILGMFSYQVHSVVRQNLHHQQT